MFRPPTSDRPAAAVICTAGVATTQRPRRGRWRSPNRHRLAHTLNRQENPASQRVTGIRARNLRGPRRFFRLVVQIAGYSRLSLVRASAVVSCQSAFVWLRLRAACQAVTSSIRADLSGTLRSRHRADSTLSSASAISSQLPCFGVKCHANRSTRRRASAGENAALHSQAGTEKRRSAEPRNMAATRPAYPPPHVSLFG